MIIKAPNNYVDAPRPWVFIAGSIEMGAAVDWQTPTADILTRHSCTVLSPRRDDFDPTQEQSIENDYFREQVEWELGALERCDLALLYFVADTKSPISLLELGLFARSKKLVVCCPEGFWRKGNVDITCRRYGVPIYESLDESLDAIKTLFKRSSWRRSEEEEE